MIKDFGQIFSQKVPFLLLTRAYLNMTKVSQVGNKIKNSLQAERQATKLILLVVCLFGLVLFATYEADLTTKMTIQEQALPLRSFEDIYNSEDNKVVVRAQTAQWTMLKKAKEGSAMRRIFEGLGEEQIVADPNCKNPCIEAMLRVREMDIHVSV